MPYRPRVREPQERIGAADGLPGNVEDIAHGAAADRDDLRDIRSAGERNAESDQQRRDATRIANAGWRRSGSRTAPR